MVDLAKMMVTPAGRCVQLHEISFKGVDIETYRLGALAAQVSFFKKVTHLPWLLVEDA